MSQERRRGRKAILIQLRQMLEMDGYGSSFQDGGRTVITNGAQATQFVRDHTKLWRDSWVFPLIDELLGKEKKGGE
jgi:hypothetical protein